MSLFDIFKKNEPRNLPDEPRKHHYDFAYKALPGLAFAGPHVPLDFASSTFSWAELTALLASSDPFGRAMANHKLAQFWTHVGAKLPSEDQMKDSGLSAVGGQFGSDHVIVLIKMPEPIVVTEAYFAAIIYPKAWFDDAYAYEKTQPDIRCYLLVKSNVPGPAGPGSSLRLVKRGGHGAVKHGIPISAGDFLQAIQVAMQNPDRCMTWVEKPTWNFFMQDGESGQTYGSS